VLSIDRQSNSQERRLIVVDASNRAVFSQNRDLLKSTSCPVNHLRYEGAPSAARQRNYGVERLPDSVGFVHFLDDDVTVHSGYFAALVRFLNRRPSVAGVGGYVDEPGSSAGDPSPAQRLFLQAAQIRGVVLPSGHTTSAQHVPLSHPIQTDWLSGCASTYRRAWLDRFRFDGQLVGYAPGEDLDLSYRIRQEAPLYVVPSASLTHHRSSQGRLSTTEYHCLSLIHRYWFVRKNIDHPLRYPAFWWAVLGQLIAQITSSKEAKYDALRGHLRGIRAILASDHRILR
jgi:GT2 family glycosyltransferase